MRKSNSSARRRMANRSNAQRSTGPRSPDGKARAAQNSVTCGFYGGDIVLKPFDPAGTAEEFAALRQGLFEDMGPKGQVQCVVVERIAAILWRQRRAYRLEGQALLPPDVTLNPVADAMYAALKTATNAPTQLFESDSKFDKVIRYESLVDRELHRALMQWARLRQDSGEIDAESIPESGDSATAGGETTAEVAGQG